MAQGLFEKSWGVGPEGVSQSLRVWCVFVHASPVEGGSDELNQHNVLLDPVVLVVICSELCV